jgi:serine phosphatase RsbU (regulator of sigma subunit)/anti-sigma regulatory factor (Ser/Thr protein kinase)
MSEPRAKSSTCVHFRYSLPCELAEVPSARRTVRKFLAEQGLHEEELAACELALAEACNNAIQNVREGGHLHPVEITVLCTNSKVEICVNDHTPGFDWPDQIELPAMESERGRGLFFIQSFMDTARYFRGKDENSLVMRKMRCHQEHRQGAATASLSELQQRLDETQHALSDMARELCFRTESLSAIFRCSTDLGRSNDLSEFTQRLLSDLLHITSADWFLLRILRPGGTELVSFAMSPGFTTTPGPLLLAAAADEAPSAELHAVRTRRDVAFGPKRPLSSRDPLAQADQCSVGLVRPLSAADNLVGTLTVGRSTSREPFTAAQVKVIHTFADFLGIQLVNARLREEQLSSRLLAHELEIARNIQRSLLPRSLPQLRHFGVAGYCESAQQVGGDFYDVLQLSDNSLLLVVADVMGKGVPAALFAAILHSLVRALPEWTQHPSELLARLNWHMYEELSAVDMFVTAQIVLINSKKNEMTVASAGHCPVLLVQSGVPGVTRVAPEGMPLGILPTTRFVDETHELKSPCRVLLHTDGLTEAADAMESAKAQRRLEKWMKESLARERTAEQLRDELAAGLQKVQRSMPLKDDQTFLIVAEHSPEAAGAGPNAETEI